MNKSIKSNAQGGFTLIELIVVIVILGILAATALPRFTDLGSDARVSSLQAARGSLSATAAMAHGKHLIRPQDTTLTVEGAIMTYTTAPVTGYPIANEALAAAAGLQDYTVFTAGTSGANQPTVPADSIAIVPTGIVGTPTAQTCFITYTQPTAVATAPTLSRVPAATDCD